MYDVIIIGAGPSGSTAAKISADNGLKVLLIEKFKMPRYKSCSGVLIKKSMDLVRLYFGEDTPDFTMCAPTENKGMIFTNDKGREYRFEQEGLNVWRSSFDHWLATKAMESGAQVRDCTSVIACEEQEGYVTVTLHGKDTYTEQAKFVIDCEGVVGSLKRKLIKNNCDYITTFQTFNKGIIDLDPQYFYAYLQPELSEYDAWFNVKDNLLVLGVSVKDTSKITYYYERFLAYMKSYHNLQLEKQLKSEKWLMPHIGSGCKVDYGIGRVLFAGEIAGFLNPMGEGISAGMESGYCAANAIATHLYDLDMISDQMGMQYHENEAFMVFCEYQKATTPLKKYMERQWDFVAGIANPFDHMKL